MTAQEDAVSYASRVIYPHHQNLLDAVTQFLTLVIDDVNICVRTLRVVYLTTNGTRMIVSITNYGNNTIWYGSPVPYGEPEKEDWAVYCPHILKHDTADMMEMECTWCSHEENKMLPCASSHDAHDMVSNFIKETMTTDFMCPGYERLPWNRHFESSDMASISIDSPYQGDQVIRPYISVDVKDDKKVLFAQKGFGPKRFEYDFDFNGAMIHFLKCIDDFPFQEDGRSFEFTVLSRHRMVDVKRCYGSREAAAKTAGFWHESKREFMAASWKPSRFVHWCLPYDEMQELIIDLETSGR